MIDAIQQLYKIVEKSPEFKGLVDIKPNETLCVNNCTTKGFIPCDEYIECLAKERSYPSLHLASSCRMGSANDVNAVVDERLRVRGVSSLRVIDASVMPTNIEPGTYATTIMIGERGAQFIKEDN